MWKKKGAESSSFIAYFTYAIVMSFISNLLLLVLFSPSGTKEDLIINVVITFLYCYFMKDYQLLKDMQKKRK